MSSNTFFIEVVDVVRTSDKAICVKVDPAETIVLEMMVDDGEYHGEDGDELWIPRSQIHEDSEVTELHDSGNLVITKWLAEQKGLW